MLNDPEVVAEIEALHAQYEVALVSNDVEKLVTFFWDSPHALRFGVGESLYGSKLIEEFRRNRPAVDLAREVSNLQIVTFGTDCAIVALEFSRTAPGVRRKGRQSQIWRKFGDAWKIVSAHVSLVPVPYVDLAGPLVGMTMPPEYRFGVERNIERAAVIAKPLLDLELEDVAEPAPIFEP
jgi:ketosteroid isomerase-like protein